MITSTTPYVAERETVATLGGVSGEAISLGGRIIAAADAFDALTSPRPYREAISAMAAVTALDARAGTLLDPSVVLALRTIIAQREAARTA